MKRIALIRSVDVKQAQPMLRKMSENLSTSNKLKLFYSDGECTNEDFCGEYEHFDSDMNLMELADRVVTWQPDIVISISLPDNNAVRDSLLSEYFKNKGIDYVMHPVESVLLLSNKWETVRYLGKKNIKVPKTIYVSGDLISCRVKNYHNAYLAFIKNQLDEIKFPVIAKPLWDSMSQGIKVFSDKNEAIIFMNSITVDYIFQEFISGELLGIEIITCGKQTFFQPLVKKYTSENLVPFDHLRYGPYTDIPNNILDKVKSDFKKVCLDLKLNGSAEFEMIYVRETESVYVLEINPRISGMTNLSSMISGVNSYNLLTKMDQLGDISAINQYTAEIPLINMDDENEQKIKGIAEIKSIQKVIYHTGKQQVKIMIAGNSLKEVIKIVFLLNKYRLISKNIIKESVMLNEMLQSDRRFSKSIKGN